MQIFVPFGLYSRIETRAGGLWSSDRAFIRAAWKKFNADGRLPEKRGFRRDFYKALFATRQLIRDQFIENTF